jgi:type I restriction enzyme R subunit
VIITTLQKFPFVSRQLLKIAKERGASGTGTLQTRRCAVIIDEAHSSQGGEAATDLKEVLGGDPSRQPQRRDALTKLCLDRDEADARTVQRGTVQHEVLVGDRATAFVDGDDIEIQVSCRADAGALEE